MVNLKKENTHTVEVVKTNVDSGLSHMTLKDLHHNVKGYDPQC